MPHDFLRFSPRIACLPVIHGSGDYAVEVRRLMLAEKFDCLAVPLPESFQQPVEQAIDHLPQVTVVIQEETPKFSVGDWSPESDDSDEEDHRPCSYVPVDPCQPVIAALRIALQERMLRAFVDLETERYLPLAGVLPDPYALKRVPVETFSAAVLPALPRLPEGQPQQRAVTMAARLRELEQQHQSILFVCSITDWPWVREAYTEQQAAEVEDDLVEDPQLYRVDPRTLIFLLGELPFITGLYERARVELDNDENLSVDGVKEMLLASRKRYQDDLGQRARKISPQDAPLLPPLRSQPLAH